MTPFLAWVKEYLQKFLTKRIMILSLEILTQRLDYCEQKYDSKNWTFESVTQKHWTLFFNMSQRIEPTFPIWVKELNPFLKIWLEDRFLNFFSKKKKMTQRIELHFLIWRTRIESHLFRIWLTEIWTLDFLIMTQRIEPFFWIWL